MLYVIQVALSIQERNYLFSNNSLKIVEVSNIGL